MREFIRFLIVGVINTLVGMGVFWISFDALGLPIWLANTAGYAVALCVAFVLTRLFVFGHRVAVHHPVKKFATAFAIAFGLNQIVLMTLVNLATFPPLLAQVCAMSVYTVVFFFLNKAWVFRDGSSRKTSPEKK